MNLKPEKCERRGKFPGTKIHLGAETSQLLIDLYKGPTPNIRSDVYDLCVAIGRCLSKLIIEYPNLLKDRTPEEIKAELENEFTSAQKKLEAIAAKKDWTQVKVPLKVG